MIYRCTVVFFSGSCGKVKLDKHCLEFHIILFCTGFSFTVNPIFISMVGVLK